MFSQKSFTEHSSNSGPAVHVLHEFPLSYFLPFELVIRVKNPSLVLEVWICSLETLSWRLSLISSCGMWSSDLRSTPWKEKLTANWNEPNTDPRADARAESLTLCWCRWQVRNSHYTLARKTRALHTQPHRKLMCVALQICHWLIRRSVGFKIKWQWISEAYRDSCS